MRGAYRKFTNVNESSLFIPLPAPEPAKPVAVETTTVVISNADMQLEIDFLRAKLARTDQVMTYIRATIYKELVLLKEKLYRFPSGQLEVEIASFFDFTLGCLQDNNTTLENLDKSMVARLRKNGQLDLLMESEMARTKMQLRRDYNLSKQELLHQLSVKTSRVAELQAVVSKMNIPLFKRRLRIAKKQVDEIRIHCTDLKLFAGNVFLEFDDQINELRKTLLIRLEEQESVARREKQARNVCGLFVTEVSELVTAVGDHVVRSFTPQQLMATTLTGGATHEIIPCGTQTAFAENVIAKLRAAAAASGQLPSTALPTSAWEAEIRKLSRDLYNLRHYFNFLLMRQTMIPQSSSRLSVSRDRSPSPQATSRPSSPQPNLNLSGVPFVAARKSTSSSGSAVMPAMPQHLGRESTFVDAGRLTPARTSPQPSPTKERSIRIPPPVQTDGLLSSKDAEMLGIRIERDANGMEIWHTIASTPKAHVSIEPMASSSLFGGSSNNQLLLSAFSSPQMLATSSPVVSARSAQQQQRQQLNLDATSQSLGSAEFHRHQHQQQLQFPSALRQQQLSPASSQPLISTVPSWCPAYGNGEGDTTKGILTVEDIKRENNELCKEVATLRAENADLNRQIASLYEQLRAFQNSAESDEGQNHSGILRPRRGGCFRALPVDVSIQTCPLFNEEDGCCDNSVAVQTPWEMELFGASRQTEDSEAEKACRRPSRSPRLDFRPSAVPSTGFALKLRLLDSKHLKPGQDPELTRMSSLMTHRGDVPDGGGGSPASSRPTRPRLKRNSTNVSEASSGQRPHQQQQQVEATAQSCELSLVGIPHLADVAAPEPLPITSRGEESTMTTTTMSLSQTLITAAVDDASRDDRGGDGSRMKSPGAENTQAAAKLTLSSIDATLRSLLKDKICGIRQQELAEYQRSLLAKVGTIYTALNLDHDDDRKRCRLGGLSFKPTGPTVLFGGEDAGRLGKEPDQICSSNHNGGGPLSLSVTHVKRKRQSLKKNTPDYPDLSFVQRWRQAHFPKTMAKYVPTQAEEPVGV